MGLERKVRGGGRLMLMGEGTKGKLYEDIINASYDAARYQNVKTPA